MAGTVENVEREVPSLGLFLKERGFAATKNKGRGIGTVRAGCYRTHRKRRNRILEETNTGEDK